MENKVILKPNFMVLRQKNNKGPIYKVTICKSTLIVLDEVVISGIPADWSVQDFYDMFDEGKRYGGQNENPSTGGLEEYSSQ